MLWINCRRCGTPTKRVSQCHTDFCFQCANEHYKEASIASRAIAKQIRCGDRKPAAEHVCVDCARPARDRDHRDYLRPLDVEPVCRPCNQRRGPAYDSVYRPPPAEPAEPTERV